MKGVYCITICHPIFLSEMIGPLPEHPCQDLQMIRGLDLHQYFRTRWDLQRRINHVTSVWIVRQERMHLTNGDLRVLASHRLAVAFVAVGNTALGTDKLPSCRH